MHKAVKVVCTGRPHHSPVWKMHSGSQDWAKALSAQQNLAHLIEYDVEDCFLNIPREVVLPTLEFWLNFEFKRRRAVAILQSSRTASQKTLLAVLLDTLPGDLRRNCASSSVVRTGQRLAV